MLPAIFLSFICMFSAYFIYDYIIWMKKFDQYPSYSVKISDVIFLLPNLFSDPDYLRRNFAGIRSALSTDPIKYNMHRDYFVLWIAFYPVLFVQKIELFEQLYKGRNVRGYFTEFAKPVLDNGLFVIRNKVKWKKSRKISEINVKTKTMANFIPTMFKHGDKLVNKLSTLSGQWIDIENYINFTTFDVVGDYSMGTIHESEDFKNLAQLVVVLAHDVTNYIMRRMSNPFLVPEFIWIRYIEYKTSGAAKRISSLFEKLVHQELSRQMALRDNSQVSSNGSTDAKTKVKDSVNFLSHWVSLYIDGLNGNGEPITLKDVQSELNNFILAGFDTVGLALNFTLACIANEPYIQERLYAEATEVLNDDLDIETVNQLVYTECCVKEGLRLFPPATGIGRTIDEDTFFDGKPLPKGTEISTIISAVHMNENIYPEPDKYDPDRFSPERINSIPKNGWCPFGLGTRSCVGYRFAMYEAKVLLAVLIKHFIFEVDVHYDQIEYTGPFTSHPMDPMNFKLTPRSTN